MSKYCNTSMVKWLSCLPSKQAARVRFPFDVSFCHYISGLIGDFSRTRATGDRYIGEFPYTNEHHSFISNPIWVTYLPIQADVKYGMILQQLYLNSAYL